MIKWNTKMIPVPPRCAICEHITKVSPNLPVCYHPKVREKIFGLRDLPRIPYPSHKSNHPDWCPKVSHSDEAMQRYILTCPHDDCSTPEKKSHE